MTLGSSRYRSYAASAGASACEAARRLAVAFTLGLALGGCPTTDPVVINPGDTNTPKGPFYADTVLALRSGGDEPTLCDQIQRKCPTAQGGECGSNLALGEPDDMGYTVAANSSFDVGFMCSIGIREIGGTAASATASDDFVVIAKSIDANAFPVVQVSNDGTNYDTLNPWPKDKTDGVYLLMAGFKLESQGLINVRYVRIAETSNKGSFSVDAVKALPLQIGQ